MATPTPTIGDAVRLPDRYGMLASKPSTLTGIDHAGTATVDVGPYGVVYLHVTELQPAGPTTHVLLVIDMSGSMTELANDVRGGYNSFLDGLTADGKGTYRITAAVFDTQYELLCVDKTLEDATRLDAHNYRPRGGTALLDAVGRTIADFEHAHPTLADGDRVQLVIYTDGEENASQEHNWDTIRVRIDQRVQTGRWAAIYLGAGPNAWAQGSRFGAHTQVVHTKHTAAGTASSYAGLTRGTIAYAAGADAKTASGLIAEAAGVNPVSETDDL